MDSTKPTEKQYDFVPTPQEVVASEKHARQYPHVGETDVIVFRGGFYRGIWFERQHVEAMLESFLASLLMCDKLSEVWNDLELLLPRLGLEIDVSDDEVLYALLAKKGVRTLLDVTLEMDEEETEQE